MKATLKTQSISLIILLLILAACENKNTPPGNDNAVTTDNNLENEMDNMMMEMNRMSHTKDAYRDFVMMMKMHHEGAVKMADYELKNGSDKQILALAKAIKDGQHAEIADFDNLLATLPPDTTGGNEFMSEMMQSMKKMEQETKNIKVTGEAAHDFVLLMIPHHQSAIEMAQSILKHVKNNKIKPMAEKIITDQQKEIEQMQSWLKTHDH